MKTKFRMKKNKLRRRRLAELEAQLKKRGLKRVPSKAKGKVFVRAEAPKISDELLAKTRVRPGRTSAFAAIDIFAPAKPPPGVLPPGMAMDAVTTPAALAWSAGFVGLGAFAEGLTFLGYPYLAELAQRPEYRVISETIATESTRMWIEHTSKGDDDDAKEDKIKELTDYLDDLKIQDAFCKLTEVDGFFGRSHLYLDTGDSDNPAELATSIGNGRDDASKAKLKRGCLRRVSVIEPIWTYPTNYNASDPLKATWYDPDVWFVMGKQVHRSRLLTFVGREVPDIFKPAYSFGGLSLSQMAKPYVDNWLRTRQSVADIIKSFTVFILATDMNTLLTPSGAEIMRRVEAFNNLRTNQGMMMVDKTREDFKNVSASLASLDVLQAQSQEHMAAVSRIPLVKLLGISPAGLNASSEGELRAFYDTIGAYQQRFMKPNLSRVIDIAQISLWGEVDPDITFKFKPLWSLDEKTLADMQKVKADSDAVYLTEGVVAPLEVRQRVANDPDSGYNGIDVEDLPEQPVDDTGELRLGLGQGGSTSSGESSFKEAAE